MNARELRRLVTLSRETYMAICVYTGAYSFFSKRGMRSQAFWVSRLTLVNKMLRQLPKRSIALVHRVNRQSLHAKSYRGRCEDFDHSRPSASSHLTSL